MAVLQIRTEKTWQIDPVATPYIGPSIVSRLLSRDRPQGAPGLFDDHDRAAGEALRAVAGGQGKAFPGRQTQGQDQAHRRGPAGSQLPHIAGRPRNADAQHRQTRQSSRDGGPPTTRQDPATRNRTARGQTTIVVSPLSNKSRVANDLRLPLARISHTKKAHRGAESVKVVLREPLLPDPRSHPDADRV
jgi:hypothetical protein